MSTVISRAEHRAYLETKRFRLKNKTPTIISSNCTGGIISHDLHIPFNSPTVNWGCIGWDYLKFLQDIEHYLSCPIEKLDNTGFNFFLGRCDDIVFQFGHLPTFEACVAKWNERKDRFNRNNMYVILTDHPMQRYEFTDSTFRLLQEKAYWDEDKIKEYDSLPIKHKVFLSNKPYPDIKCVHYMKGFEDQESVGVLTDFKPGFWRRRYIDDFDYVKFLNER